MSETNGPEHLPELKAEVLRLLQERRGASSPLFANPVTQREMLARDHTFDAQHLEVKAEQAPAPSRSLWYRARGIPFCSRP